MEWIGRNKGRKRFLHFLDASLFFLSKKENFLVVDFYQINGKNRTAEAESG
jgi:hypothetical protein